MGEGHMVRLQALPRVFCEKRVAVDVVDRPGVRREQDVLVDDELEFKREREEAWWRW
jgi:hypothetical protein